MPKSDFDVYFLNPGRGIPKIFFISKIVHFKGLKTFPEIFHDSPKTGAIFFIFEAKFKFIKKFASTA